MNILPKLAYIYIFAISCIWIIISLYYSYFWDIYINLLDGVFFDTSRAIKPCDMCRYIRTAQYPLALISWIALRYKDYFGAKKYIYGLAFVWIIFCLYKILLETWIITLHWNWICGAGSLGCDVATYMFGTKISLAAAWCAWLMCIVYLTSRVEK